MDTGNQQSWRRFRRFTMRHTSAISLRASVALFAFVSLFLHSFQRYIYLGCIRSVQVSGKKTMIALEWIATCRKSFCAARIKRDLFFSVNARHPTVPTVPTLPQSPSMCLVPLHHEPPPFYASASASGTNCLPSFNTYSANPSTLIIFNPHSFANRQQSSRLAMDPAGSYGLTSSHKRPAGGRPAR